MVSNIVSGTIDAAYPVAGVDNDTQGFRDNFNIIKTGLSTAASEITQLQNSTAKLDEENNFNGTTIADANLVATTEKYLNAGTKVIGDNISFLNGHYQRFALSTQLTGGANSITFTLADWPDREGLAKITVEIFDASNSGNREVMFEVEGGGTIRYADNWPNSIQTPTWPEGATAETAPLIVVEFWTVNQGNTIYANYLGVFT